MSTDILATRPLSRNDVSRLATLIEAILLQFQSKPSPDEETFINLLDELVRLGLYAAIAYGCYEKGNITLRLFNISKKQPKLRDLFAQSSAKLIKKGVWYAKIKGCAPFDEQFTKAARATYNLMVTHRKNDATTLLKLFAPMTASVKRPWETLN